MTASEIEELARVLAPMIAREMNQAQLIPVMPDSQIQAPSSFLYRRQMALEDLARKQKKGRRVDL